MTTNFKSKEVGIWNSNCFSIDNLAQIIHSPSLILCGLWVHSGVSEVQPSEMARALWNTELILNSLSLSTALITECMANLHASKTAHRVSGINYLTCIQSFSCCTVCPLRCEIISFLFCHCVFPIAVCIITVHFSL